ncbi:hypothetical protein GGS24DRAFT_495555 [Hypoxylon argillaceum]|nr:hypothetical protein GGS24DRAFT_495555 [Hypoxylon argillaceum]KAI1155937.1 hypothetical protein F4825DRAFT_405393 [Nemania diffusa]
MRTFTAVATAALLASTAHAVSKIPQQYIDITVAPGNDLAGYLLIASPDFPELVPANRTGGQPADWYLNYAAIYIGVEYYWITIGVNGINAGLTLSDKNTPGPLQYMPASYALVDNALDYWQPYEAGFPGKDSAFDYTSTLQSGAGLSTFGCKNSAGRYQLSAYPSGQGPANCVQVGFKWSTAPFCSCPRP